MLQRVLKALFVCLQELEIIDVLDSGEEMMLAENCFVVLHVPVRGFLS